MKKFAILAMIVTTMMTLTSCRKGITDYLIGQWNKVQLTITVGEQVNTEKLNGNYRFDANGDLFHTYKPRNGSMVTDQGTWNLANEAFGSLWLTFNNKTQVVHIDQIDEHSMQWTYYEKNQANENVTYVYKLSR